MQVLSKIVIGRPLAAGMALLGVLAMAGCGSGTTVGGTVTATPTFSPAGGSFNTSQTVTIADTTPGAVLYCTVDGTLPTTSSPKCAQPFTVYQTQFLQAIAIAPSLTASPVAAAAFTINLNATATPIFSPAGGTYNANQTVTINDATTGANIFYTLDGSTPIPGAVATMVYTGALTVSKNETINAMAAASGLNNSGVATASYTIKPLTVSPPTFTPAAGQYSVAQTVQIADSTPNAIVYYTIDGSQPTASSAQYTGPLTVSSSETVTAVAIVGGASSATVSAAYGIVPPAATPTFTPAAGTYTSAQSIEIDDATPGATIYYTTNGSTPTTSSMQYTGTKISVPSSQTLLAIATASGFSNSAIGSAAYTINLPGTPAPVITPDSGSYNSVQTVTITDSDAKAAIYYTNDGSTPTTSSTSYTAPFQMSKSGMVSAIAVDSSAGANSPVVTKTYTISIGTSKVTGSVFGGTAAISGAQVQLYAAGTSGYGAGATALGAPTSTATDGTGSFTVNYDCPAAPGDQVYLVATGGDAGGGNNPSAVLMAALGSCNGLTGTTPVTVNEVTTVAAAYSLAQFAATNTSGAGITVGTSTGNAIGLSNAMKTPGNLVDATGTALTITPFYKAAGGTSGGILNSSYVPQARINTLADVLAACVETDGTTGTACSSLYSAATPTGGSSPIDTLQAILSIAQHPGNNAAGIYGLYTSSQPFQPALTAAPADWTLALTFTGGGLGIAPAIAASNPVFATNLGSLLVDAQGNIWGGATEGCLDPSTFNSVAEIVEFDSQGNGISPAAIASNSYCGGYQPQFDGAPVVTSPTGMAVDLNGAIWMSPDGRAITKMSSDGTINQANYQPGGFSSGNCYPTTLAVDASNNLWMGCTNASGSSFGGIGEMNTTDGSWLGGQGLDGPNLMDIVGGLALDLSGNVWAVPGSTISGVTDFTPFYQISAVDGQFDIISDHTDSGNTFTASVVVDGLGNVYSLSTTAGVINALAPDGTTFTQFAYPAPSGAVGISQLALDGAGNLWGPSFPGGIFSAATTPSGLVEMSGSGTLLSPSGTGVYGYTGTGGGGETQPILSDWNGSRGAFAGIAVDGSGNVWVGNQGFPTNTKLPIPTLGEQLVEFIGIAAPVATPAQSLATNKVGVRP